MAKTDLTAQRLRELLSYNPDTGEFVWLVRTGGRRLAGQPAGVKNIAIGYCVIGIDGSRYYAHRLAWLYMTGNHPAQDIDHINGDRADNRFCNLRDVSKCMNLQNMRKRPAGASDLPLGTYFDKKYGVYRAGLRVDGRRKEVGKFATPEEAHAAYIEAKRRLHPGCTI